MQPQIDAAIRARHSVRAYRRDAVPRDTVHELLALAARAPSGTNIQPWGVTVLGRSRIDAMVSAITTSGVHPHQAPWDDYRYYPKVLPDPFASRRRALGAALYGLLGIGRRDVRAMRQHFARNFDFFGAPVGLLITIDRRLEKGSWLDLGMFIQTFLLAAEARGLGTCVQAAFAPYHRQIRPIAGLKETDVLVCGIALGYPDQTRPENALRTERAPLEDWVVDHLDTDACPEAGRVAA
jgi:nitroreductase